MYTYAFSLSLCALSLSSDILPNYSILELRVLAILPVFPALILDPQIGQFSPRLNRIFTRFTSPFAVFYAYNVI